MSESNSVPSVQRVFPVFGILGIIFVVMKVMGWGAVASWSWWLVLLPFYGGLAIILGIFVIGAIGLGLLMGIAKLLEKPLAARSLKRRQELYK